MLVLLDFTAAFDTAEHTILMLHLEPYVGIKVTALEWFRTYLSQRSFSSHLGGSVSATF